MHFFSFFRARFLFSTVYIAVQQKNNEIYEDIKKISIYGNGIVDDHIALSFVHG